MLFLLRSAFWLTVAFVVIRPGFDVREAAATASHEAMTRGSQMVAEQIGSIQCDSLQCLGGKALAQAALSPLPHAGDPMHAQPATGSVPLPRPRPDRAG